ncbi:hypothetical protein AB0G54_24985 [Streptomyces yokosukanensis]|uniref:MmyB family transcriptional regulator n=1 Tax=Streptomyces yokosukanensis TaxID=67386 RepID=UPI0034354A1F
MVITRTPEEATSSRKSSDHPVPFLGGLVGELSVHSADFGRWWADHDVLEYTHGTKRSPPLIGELALDYESLTLPDDPDQALYLYLYTAEPDSASAHALRLLGSSSATSSWIHG